ncbi:MAG: (d)CMP kinase [Flavobacteriales bacterium]|nr:(d)CMP kinase [Flavobacteriales bacterium]
MNNKINIAIDGHSSCGKSTIAKAISKKYKMTYIDTGAMYRAITLFCLQNEILKDGEIDLNLLKEELPKIDVRFEYNQDKQLSETFLNDENIESKIRGLEVSENVSKVAKIQMVREKLVVLQQSIGDNGNVVMDGRDIGTKIFPDARLKFFVTADVNIRAERRWKELKLKEDINFDMVLQNLKMRDENDSNREINPLKKAEDAILIDNSEISVLEQNKFIFSIIDKVKL